MAQPSDEAQIPIIPETDANLYNDEVEGYASGSGESNTASLTSSIINYQYENGRRYHAYRQGEYLFPNDEREQERLDLHHHICTMVQEGALYKAPLKSGIKRVLDLGTGTGAWAIEMADLFPEAIVTGTDLSPIQPSWVPPNCIFEVDDYELQWNFPRPFDFIHMRGVEGSVKNFSRLFAQANKNLAPGGWFEICDFTVGVFSDDNTIERATYLLEWRDRLLEASEKFGKKMDVAKNYKQWMIDAGFKNVREEIFKVPFSPWAKNPKLKELGRYHQANMLEALEAYSFALFTRFLGWSMEEVQVFLMKVRKELTDRTLHAYSRLYVVYGQRESHD